MRWLRFGKKNARKKIPERHADTLEVLLKDYLKPSTGIPKNFSSQATEGFEKNVIVYRVVMSIAQAVASIPYWVTINGKDQDEGNVVVQSIARPNPLQGYQEFIRNLILHRLIGGNAYAKIILASTKRLELHLLRPDRVQIRTSSTGELLAYEHSLNGKAEIFPVDPISLRSELWHSKEPNLLDDLYGLSPIQATALGIKQHNETILWNKKLLENAARPEGVLVFKDKGEGSLPPSQEELDRVKEDFYKKYTGPQNAGKIPFLNFDMKWEQMGLTPKDMDWIQGKNTTARDIALAFGYPPHLLGLAEGSTFNNVAEAKLSFYLETVKPLVESTLESLSHFLSHHLQEEILIKPDMDEVEALGPLREIKLRQTREDFVAGIITLNEAREARQREPMANGDDVLVPAGKLPLSFDPGSLDEEQYRHWLINEGFQKSEAEHLSKIAYGQESSQRHLLKTIGGERTAPR